MTCQAETRTAGPPAAIRLSVDRNTITAAPGDVAHVTFDVVDSAGVVVPTASHRVTFTVTGGNILAIDNANLQDLEPYSKENRRAFNGRGLAYVRSAQPGQVTIRASAAGLREGSLTITVERGQPVATVPAAR
jgi:beta-galactosidase